MSAGLHTPPLPLFRLVKMGHSGSALEEVPVTVIDSVAIEDAPAPSLTV